MTTEHKSGSKVLHESVRKEVTQQAAKWLIASAIGLIAIAAIGWWLYIKPKLIELAGGVPPGVVVAFDGPRDCPNGWESFEEAAGRTIIGTGKGRDVTERRYREVGGEEVHLLSPEEMPTHTHEVVEMVV